MPSNTMLGGVFMTDVDGGLNSNTFISSENVCGIIFDTKIVGGLTNALSGVAAELFANGNVVELNSLDDVKEAGLETVMYGLPYFHLRDFFTIAGSNQRLFVSFTDSTTDTDFECIEKMQLAANGIIYQIGLWTGEAFAAKQNDGSYKVVDRGLLSKLQAQAEVLGGKIGVTNYDGNQPLNILVSAPVINEAICDITKLPDLTGLDFPKVTVLLGQSITDETHDIQVSINTAVANKTNYAVTGCVGAALGVLAIASAEQSMGWVRNFGLSAVMTQAELGFGNLTIADGAWGDNVSFTNIKSLNYTKRNNLLHRKGYVFLRDYENRENQIYFSSDQTLSTGDYRRISRCRVMHKSRRVVRQAVLPYVEETFDIDASTGYILAADVAMLQNTIYDALDHNMVQPANPTVLQISGRQVIIDPEQDLLANDQLLISYALVPKGVASAIFSTEGFALSVGNS